MSHFHGYSSYKQIKKRRAQAWRREHQAGGFKCAHCKQWVTINGHMGTIHRNHCSVCLWSKHVDESKGDRRATCHGGMRPIGLTFKHEGSERQGELMLVHECASCGKLSINRIARDDGEDEILRIFARSRTQTTLSARLQALGIYLLNDSDESELHAQLFGK